MSKLPEGQSLKVHVGDFEASQPVMVKIYNQKHKLIHSEEIKNAESFSRIYDLSKIRSQTVSVLIENNGERQTFTHSFR